MSATESVRRFVAASAPGSRVASPISRRWRTVSSPPRGSTPASVQVAATAVFQPGPRHVAVFHAEAGWRENPAPGEEFDLGLGSGPRAFGSHAFTGDRSVFATAEYRYTVVEDLLNMVGLGVAGFVDHGGAWYAGSPEGWAGMRGWGSELGASRSSVTDALRFDFARRFANDVESGRLGA